MSINNVIVCGLGAVGMTFGARMLGKCNLKVLVDKEHLEKYKNNPQTLNGEIKSFDYILPEDNFDADLIVISTKLFGLDSAIKMIKNFVSSKTIIISLLNGISSEETVSHTYQEAKVLKSYFIGHSAVREGNNIVQDGVGEIVFEYNQELEEFFKRVGINYSNPENIVYSMWVKYIFNIFSNQTSAILNITFGEMKNNSQFKVFAKKIIDEVKLIAQKQGVKGIDNIENDAINSLNKMCDEGKTSMLQDVLANRKTEVELFAGEVIKLGKKYSVPTPINQVLYDLIKIREEVDEYRVHSGEGRK